jgi:hypothetical protein
VSIRRFVTRYGCSTTALSSNGFMERTSKQGTPSNNALQLTRSHGTVRTWSRCAAPRATAPEGPRS